MTNTNHPKFRRHAPESGRIFAEQMLFEEMERAAELLNAKADFGRAGLRCALRACHDYLHVRGLSGQGLKALVDALAALDTVDKGTLPEIFDPKMQPGVLPERKWSRSAAAQETRIYVAACLDALMNSGMSQDNAAAKVAASARNWPRISSSIINFSTVVNWRDGLMQQQSIDPDRQKFEGISRMLSDGPCSARYLNEVLKDGPPMTGGVRKSKT